MKKFILSFAVVALIFGGLLACGEQTKWNREERQAMRNLLRDYRKMVYLNDLSEAEYMLFTDDVIASVEEAYPVYTTFVEMPAVNDTVQVYVVTTIVDELNADAHNMRHIYPYRYLVSEGMLPEKLSLEQQRQFYKCFAQKVNQTFLTMQQFFNAVMADTTAQSQIRQLQSQCANDLFGWVIEVDEIDVVE